MFWAAADPALAKERVNPSAQPVAARPIERKSMRDALDGVGAHDACPPARRQGTGRSSYWGGLRGRSTGGRHGKDSTIIESTCKQGGYGSATRFMTQR